jgi:hypothetical protein
LSRKIPAKRQKKPAMPAASAKPSPNSKPADWFHDRLSDAIERDDGDAARRLLAEGADPLASSGSGLSFIGDAARNGRPRALEAMLGSAQEHARRERELHLLPLSLMGDDEQGAIACMRMVLALPGVDPNMMTTRPTSYDTGHRLFPYAARAGRVETLKVLLDYCDPQMPSHDGSDALMSAAHFLRPEAVRLLIGHCDPKRVLPDGNCALSAAITQHASSATQNAAAALECARALADAWDEAQWKSPEALLAARHAVRHDANPERFALVLEKMGPDALFAPSPTIEAESRLFSGHETPRPLRLLEVAARSHVSPSLMRLLVRAQLASLGTQSESLRPDLLERVALMLGSASRDIRGGERWVASLDALAPLFTPEQAWSALRDARSLRHAPALHALVQAAEIARAAGASGGASDGAAVAPRPAARI